eukprot:NODE_837_length_2740_cov_7.967853.p1 GENE.NODE_837_length_2740_cov_7.967853~~NODE_837_length_2740_cov_7.967853.p1  ORF type:complete len:746 (-),score=128.81 NODE_837_length_2740_cov_7.967853:501-2738(-)
MCTTIKPRSEFAKDAFSPALEAYTNHMHEVIERYQVAGARVLALASKAGRAQMPADDAWWQDAMIDWTERQAMWLPHRYLLLPTSVSVHALLQDSPQIVCLDIKAHDLIFRVDRSQLTSIAGLRSHVASWLAVEEKVQWRPAASPLRVRHRILPMSMRSVCRDWWHYFLLLVLCEVLPFDTASRSKVLGTLTMQRTERLSTDLHSCYCQYFKTLILQEQRGSVFARLCAKGRLLLHRISAPLAQQNPLDTNEAPEPPDNNFNNISNHNNHMLSSRSFNSCLSEEEHNDVEGGHAFDAYDRRCLENLILALPINITVLVRRNALSCALADETLADRQHDFKQTVLPVAPVCPRPQPEQVQRPARDLDACIVLRRIHASFLEDPQARTLSEIATESLGRYVRGHRRELRSHLESPRMGRVRTCVHTVFERVRFISLLSTPLLTQTQRKPYFQIVHFTKFVTRKVVIMADLRFVDVDYRSDPLDGSKAAANFAATSLSIVCCAVPREADACRHLFGASAPEGVPLLRARAVQEQPQLWQIRATLLPVKVVVYAPLLEQLRSSALEPNLPVKPDPLGLAAKRLELEAELTRTGRRNRGAFHARLRNLQKMLRARHLEVEIAVGGFRAAEVRPYFTRHSCGARARLQNSVLITHATLPTGRLCGSGSSSGGGSRLLKWSFCADTSAARRDACPAATGCGPHEELIPSMTTTVRVATFQGLALALKALDAEPTSIGSSSSEEDAESPWCTI